MKQSAMNILARWAAGFWLVAVIPRVCPAEDVWAVDALFPAPPPASPAAKVQANPAPNPTEPPDTAQLNKRIEAIETRLGASSRPPSVANNMERRLADLEKRVQQIEQQLARMQQFDQRIRRLEMK